MSGLEFADERAERAKYFICTLKVLGRSMRSEGNCIGRV